MESTERLVSLVENVMKVVGEIVKVLMMKQVKQHRYRPHLCYACRRPGHLARSCSLQTLPINQMNKKDQYEYRIRNDHKKRKKDTDPNSESQDIKIFRCSEVEGKSFADNAKSDEFSKVKPCRVGVKGNKSKAFERHQKSAELSDANRTSSVGGHHYDEISVEKDENKASERYSKSAKGDNACRRDNLGCDYEKGSSIENDKREPFIHYQKYTNMGDPNGDRSCYRNGIKAERDENKAFEYCQESANTDDTDKVSRTRNSDKEEGQRTYQEWSFTEVKRSVPGTE